MAKKTYEQWLKERDVDHQSVKGLTGVNTMSTEALQQLPSQNLQKLTKIPGIAGPDLQQTGGIYTLPGISPSVYDEDLGEGILDPQVVLQNRANEQSGLLKITNATFGGILSGLLTAGETAGYLADVANNVQTIADMEDIEDNFVSEELRKAKQSLYEVMPVYEDVESNGVIDQFTRWSTLRGMLDSAVGFAIPGGIVSKGIKGLGAGARLAAWANAFIGGGKSNLFKSLLKAGNPVKIAAGIESLAGGLITNYGEGKMMAIELGEELENQYLNNHSQRILKDKYANNPEFADIALEEAREMFANDEDTKREIGKQQTNFMKNNTIFAITDAIGLHNIGLSKAGTRALAKKASLNPLKNMGGIGGLMIQNTKEGIEEIGQNMFQSEAGYQARMATDIQTSEDAELIGASKLDRYIEFATSDKALLEGMMGFFSGGLQRQLTQGFSDAVSGDPLGKKRREEQNRRYEIQQKLMENYTEAKLKDIETAQLFKEEFLKNNQESLVDMIDDTQFFKIARDAAQSGTVGKLERSIRDIIRLTPEQAEEKGFSKDYKVNFQNRLKELQDIERMYLQHDGYKTQDLLASNRVTHKILANSQKKYQDTLINGYKKEDGTQVISELEELNKVLNESKITPELEGGIIVTKVTFENFAVLKDSKQASQIINLPEYKRALKSYEGLYKIEESIKQNNDAYQHIITEVESNYDKYQKEAQEVIEKSVNISKEVTNAEIELEESLVNLEEDARQSVINKFKTKYADSSIATSINDIIERVNTRFKNFNEKQNKNVSYNMPEKQSYTDFTQELAKIAETDPELKQKFDSLIRYIDRIVESDDTISRKNILHLNSEEGRASILQMADKEEGPLFFKLLDAYVKANSTVTSPVDSVIYTDDDFEGDDKVYVSNSSKDAIIEKDIQNIDDSIKEQNDSQSGLSSEEVTQNSQTKFEYERKRRSIWNSIAHLARNYIVEVIGKKVAFKDATNNPNRPELLRNLQNVKSGDEIEFIVIDDPAQEVYEIGFNGDRNKTTWEKHSGNTKVNRNLFIPIEIRHNGKLIGYVHSLDYLTLERDLDYNQSLKSLGNLRKIIYENYTNGKPNIKTKITNISLGHLIKTAENKPVNTKDAFPSTKVKIAISKNKQLVSAQGVVLNDNVLNNIDNLKDGFTYAIVPISNDKSIAIPLQRNNLQTNQVNNINEAFTIFNKVLNGQQLTTTEQSIVNDIQKDLKDIQRSNAGKLEKVNFNITSLEGLRNYISIYTHIHRAAGPSFDLLKVLADRPTNSAFRAISIEAFEEKPGNDPASPLVGRRFTKITMASSNEVAIAYKYFPAINGKPAHLTIINNKNIRNEFSGDDAIREFNTLFKGETEGQNGKLANHISQMTFTPSLTLLSNREDTQIKLRDLKNPSKFITDVPYSEYVKQNTSSNIISLNIAEEGDTPQYIYTQQQTFNFDDSFANLQPSTKKEENTTSSVEESKESFETPISQYGSDTDINEDGLFADDELIAFSLDDGEVNLTDESLSKSLIESQLGVSIFSPNLQAISPTRQVLEIQTMVELLSQKLLNSKDKKLSEKEWKSIIDLRMHLLNTTLRESAEKKGSLSSLNFINEVTNPQVRQYIEQLVIKVFSERAGIKANIIRNKIDEEDDLDFTDNEGYAEKLRYTDSYSFEQDHRLTMSTKLKLTLSTVPSNREGFGKVQLSYPFDEIYDTTMALLEGSEPSYDIMIAKLQTYSDIYPWINSLINHLNKQDESVKNGFVVVMHKHYVDMLFLGYKKLQQGYKMKVWHSNSNAIERTISEQWFNRLIKNEQLIQLNASGNYIFTEKAIEIAKNLKGENLPSIAENLPIQKNVIKNTLQQFGIYLSDKTIDEILSSGLYYRGNKQRYMALFGENGLIIKDLKSNILNASELERDSDDINLFGSGIMKALIKLEAKYTKTSLSNSHKTGSKTVNSFSDTRYQVDRLAELKRNKQLLTRLSQMPFSKRSTLLKVLAQYDPWTKQFVTKDGLLQHNDIVNNDSEMANAFQNLQIHYLGLNAVKEIASEYVADKSLDELGAREHDGIKLAFFFNNKSITEKGSRMGQLFYPTMSNKTVMTTMQVPLSRFELTEDGQISENTLKEMIEVMVLPEIDRMLAFKLATNSGEIKGPLADYDMGTQVFYITPQLNTISELFEPVNGKRMIKSDMANMDVLYPLIKDSYSKFIEDSINEQISDWQKIDVGVDLKFIDNDHANYYKQILPQNSIAVQDENGNTTIEQESSSNYNERLVKLMALDFVGNYMYHNMNIFQLFSGDPALYFTKKHINDLQNDNYTETTKKVFNNIGKRLAADVAPGLQGDFTKVGKSYNIGVVNDPKLSSEIIDIYKKMGLSDSEVDSYKKITTTDGAEFVTLEEHLKIMFVYNKLTHEQYKRLSDRLVKQQKNPNNTKYDFTKEDLDLITDGLNLIINKPVQVINRPIGYGNNVNPEIDSRIYIKSAATPLIPQLTRGLQLDAIRVRMESKRNPSQKIDRLVFASAMKVGVPANVVSIYDDNTGDVLAENLNKIPMITLDRSGFRIQQEIPFRADHETINDGTQQRELLFAGLLDNPELSKLYTEYLDLYHTIFSKAYDKLAKEIDYNSKTGRVDVNKVLAIVKNEAINRNYSINNIIALGLDAEGKLKYPLWGLPADSSIESLLLSIVDNRVRKLKVPGMAAILSPQEGFKEKDSRFQAWEDVSNTLSKEDLIITSEFNGTLLPMRPENPNDPNSKWLPAQILISSVLKDAFGRDIKVRDYAIQDENGKWILDTNVLPKEVLRAFSYRIPTSSQSSMGYVEIVGFLPEAMKETVVAAKDFINQMGYDFDVDKLYNNLYQIAYNPLQKKFQRLEELDAQAVTNLASVELSKRGFIPQPIDEEEDVLEVESTVINKTDAAVSALEAKLRERMDNAKDFNRLLDIHIEVMTHPETNKLRVKTVNYGKLESLANEFSQKKTTSESFNPLSPLYQKTKYINATAGQQGVGVFSAGIVFLASIQAAKVNYQTLNKDGGNYFKITLNGYETTGDLHKSMTLDGKDTRLSIMSKFQNASVDDEALQVLAALNINSNTFNTLTAGTMLGFNEEQLITLINQPIIVKFAENLKALQGQFSEYDADAEKTVVDKLFKSLAISEEQGKQAIYKFKNASVETLKEFIGKTEFKNESEHADFNAAQYFALYTFNQLKKVGQDILKVQNAVNISSKGIGKSFIVANKTYNSIKNIETYNPNFTGLESLIGKYKRSDSGDVIDIVPTTIRGFVFKYVLEPALNIYKDSNNNPLFPYVQRTFREQMELILSMQGKSDLAGDAYQREVKHIFSALKSYIYSKANIFGINNPIEERKRLLIDKKYKTGEEKELGYNIGDRKYSLAGFLELLKDENHPAIQSNKFLKRLEYTINQDGLPSIISYRATVAQSMEELEIYNDFSRLLLHNAPITITKGKDTFTISTRDLAIDLIKYNYLTGGVQGPTNYTRYIPIQYLLNAGVGNQLNQIDFTNEDLYGTPTSGFILEYFQHFPNKVKDVLPIVGKFTSEHLQYVSSKEDYYVDSEGYLTSFIPSEEFINKYQDGIPMLFKMNIGGNKYELFVLDEATNRYNRISTLKYKNISEYQGDLPKNMVAQSLFIHNQTSTLKLTTKGTTQAAKGVSKNSDKSERDAYLEKYFPKDENSLIAALNEMLTDTVYGGAAANAKLKTIGKKIIEALEANGIDPMVYVKHQNEMPKHPSGAGVRGAYLPNGDILIRRNLPTSFDKDKAMRPAEYFMTTLTHEAVHALLDKIVDKYLAGEAISKDIKIALDKLEAMRNLTHIKAQSEKITDVEIAHGVSSLKEFLTAITSSHQFREFIENDTNKSRFREILKELLSAIFGIDFMNNNLDFIDNNVMAILDNLSIGSSAQSFTVSNENELLLTSQTINLVKFLANNPTIKDVNASINMYKIELQHSKEDGLTKQRVAALEEAIKTLENYIENYQEASLKDKETSSTVDKLQNEEFTIKFSLENAINEGKVVSLENFNTEIQEQIRSMIEWQNKNC